ncbi:MAG: diguanylate cyclase [Deltaproteobacteria bacterium]|nr:diguanylate cyclase [Deltaproteobacteria bacterium]
MDIAKVIKVDPVLSSQILKSVNSPFYGLRRKASTVDQAVNFMGIRAVRNLVLCLGVQDLSPKKNSNFPTDKFWENSLRRASAAKCIARKLKMPDEEEYFTLGLCQDLGLLIIIQNADENVKNELASSIDNLNSDRIIIEQKYGKTHCQAGGELFEKWEFPPDMIEVVRWHHIPENASGENLKKAKIAFAAESLCDLLSIKNKHVAIDIAKEALNNLNINTDELTTLLDEIAETVTHAAEMLEIKVGVQPSFEEIMKIATQGLHDLNLNYQTLTSKLEESLAEQQRMANQLKILNRELERRATTDELTSLPNRRAFDEGLNAEVERSRRLDKPLALLMMDVDHFKIFNDTYGHQAGDVVLQIVAKSIKDQVRGCDLPARFGGEEFTVLLPHTNLEGAVIAAERIRTAVEKSVIEYENNKLHVTISIGASITFGSKESRAELMLLRRADDALYEAKESGRNKVMTKDFIIK